MNKLFKHFLILCVAVSFAACSTDDDNSNNNDTSGELVGTWDLISLDYNGNTFTSMDGQGFNIDFVGFAENIDYSLTFTENPNEFLAGGSYDINASSTFEGQTTTINESFDGVSSEGTWEQNGNILTVEGTLVDAGTTLPVNMDIETAPTVISELTDTTLVLTQEINQEQTANGVTITISVFAETTYTRQ